MNKIRKIPPVCLFIAFAKLLTGRLRFSRKYLGNEVRNEEGKAFKIFRNIKNTKNRPSMESCVFVVSFKFARLSHRANTVASIIPMLLIAGFPGFVQKLYAVNEENGYWQGMYEWRSAKHLEAYKLSFVYRMMNKRSLPGTVHSHTISNGHLSDLNEPDKTKKEKLS
jgi:hypothetical protein